MMDVIDQINEERKKQSMSYFSIAIELDVSEQTVNAWFNHIKSPRLHHLYDLLYLLNLDLKVVSRD